MIVVNTNAPGEGGGTQLQIPGLGSVVAPTKVLLASLSHTPPSVTPAGYLTSPLTNLQWLRSSAGLAGTPGLPHLLCSSTRTYLYIHCTSLLPRPFSICLPTRMDPTPTPNIFWNPNSLQDLALISITLEAFPDPRLELTSSALMSPQNILAVAFPMLF